MSGDAAKAMTAFDLSIQIQHFIRDNERSPSLELRWLSSYLAGALSATRQVHGGRLDLEADFQERVAKFRLNELAAARITKRHELEAIEAEERELISGYPQATTSSRA